MLIEFDRDNSVNSVYPFFKVKKRKKQRYKKGGHGRCQKQKNSKNYLELQKRTT